MKLDQRSMVGQHLLDTLLAAVEKLPESTWVEPRDVLVGMAEMLGGLLGTLPTGIRDDLLLEVLRVTVQRATKTKTTVREVILAPVPATKH